MTAMGEPARVESLDALERGAVTFLHRPRVEDGIQRLFLLLAPEDSTTERLIAIGRKRLPPPAQHPRFWGYVDLVLAPNDMSAALGSHVYGTNTHGPRHLPAARPFAYGTYELVRHGPHSHLRWTVDRVEDDQPIEREADYIITIANPDPTLWGLLETPDVQSELFDELELHVTIPTPFPPKLQARFHNRKYAQLDSPEWLDHPGAELVFVGAGE